MSKIRTGQGARSAIQEAETPDNLSDHIALVLLDMDGGPVPLSVIIKFLKKKQVEVTDAAVINAMRRKPDRFARSSYGMYRLIFTEKKK